MLHSRRTERVRRVFLGMPSRDATGLTEWANDNGTVSGSVSSPASRDPVAIALGWLIGEELGRAKRIRGDDFLAAARALGLSEDDLPAIEAYLREAAVMASEDPDVLPLVEHATVPVFFDLRDVEVRQGSEPPWELVPLKARLRIGEKRNRLIRAIPEFNASTGASLRDNFEHPLLERLAAFVRATTRDRPEPRRISPRPPRARTLQTDRNSALREVSRSARAAYQGLLIIAAVALRNHEDSGWAVRLVSELEAKHPGLLTAQEVQEAIRWLVRVGATDLDPHNWEAVTRQQLAELREGLLASERRAISTHVGGPEERADTLFRLIVAEHVRRLGPEVVHVLAEAGLTDGARPLEQLVEAEITKELRGALRRERRSSDRVATGGLLSRPFVNLEGNTSPATMLRPAYGVVPFDDSAGELRRLVQWANAPVARSVVALLGPAGSGKTRLAIEFCRALSRQGWTTGMMTRPVTDPGPIAALMQWSARRVVVVDYAEDRPDQVRSTLTRLQGAGSLMHPIRLLLIVRRSFGAGWRSAFRGSDGDSLLDTAHELDVIDAWQHVNRDDFFQSAQTAFGSHLDLSVREHRKSPAWVHSPTLDRPLLLAAAALSDLVAPSGDAVSNRGDADEVIRGLLSHEANYWIDTPAGRNETTRQTLTARALIAAALGQSLQELTERELAARLEYASDLADETTSARRRWARWLLGHYPGGRLEPDLLLEQLVVDQCANASPDDPIDWVAALASGRSPSDVAATLTLIARVAQRSPRFVSTVSVAWSRAFAPLLEVARTSSDDDGQLLTSLAAVAEALPVSSDIEDIALDLPDDDSLIGIGKILLRKTVTSLQERGTNDDRMFTALLALGVYSGMMSEHDEAIAATTRAVEWVRRTASEDTGRRAELAVSLSNLGGDLAEAGEHAAAITASQEAVSLSWEVFNEGVPQGAIALAAALQNFGGCLTTAGDHRGALAATSEAVGLIRASPSPALDAEQLSLGLTNLALSFLHLGQPDEAADAAEEAVTLWRPLARKSSIEYGPQLLKAMSTLATALARSDDAESALERRREAVALARRLYAHDPQRWHEELAWHLKLLTRSLANRGLTEEEAKIRGEVESLTQANEPDGP